MRVVGAAFSITRPVFTELLAMEVLERKAGEATVQHPNTPWRLVVHEGGPRRRTKVSITTMDFASAAIKKSKRLGNIWKQTKKGID